MMTRMKPAENALASKMSRTTPGKLPEVCVNKTEATGTLVLTRNAAINPEMNRPRTGR
jgi:hypothetical protein